ncbi:hypothetical protein Q9295_16610 [Xinfangfangia sp. CPCC 101601]|uniref:Porin n=1 Tax=Pseudogemmobacter lacusdianii TaxID=3069608 RepID=A0ABU0W1W2_9RHOB|nr:hypothetical protein [Xinfangfangia sp. CPCC 101601]MDQ2067998.1 hypothetical protein [Xinfangfangia sp. CPCC 101601]
MKRAALLPLFLLAAAPAQAFELTGGSVGVGYSGYTSNLLKNVDKTTLDGQLELSFGDLVSVQADLGFANFGFDDGEGHNIALHGIYHLGFDTSAGLYLGRDKVGDDSATLTGLEIAHKMGPVGLEGYVTYANDSNFNGLVGGAEASYGISDSLDLGVRWDRANIDNFDLTRLSLVGEYDLPSGLALTGEIGSAKFNGAGSEPFFGIGAKMNFGSNGGTTFRDRSLLDLVPGL